MVAQFLKKLTNYTQGQSLITKLFLINSVFLNVRHNFLSGIIWEIWPNAGINLFRTVSSINADKSIFYLPNYASLSYNTEPKNVITKTFLVALTAFRMAFGSSNK